MVHVQPACSSSRPQDLTPAQLQLFRYIEDADLWRWRLPDSKAFHAGLMNLGLEFDANKNPRVFDMLLAQTPEALIARSVARRRRRHTACQAGSSGTKPAQTMARAQRGCMARAACGIHALS